MLANLVCFSLDRRLSGLAARLGARYTRYADDLVFSGDRRLIRDAPAIERLVATICADESFMLNERKRRVMPRSARQRVTGVVVNERVNVPREEFDRLKATLFNAVRDGPTSQNREGLEDFRAHLTGRVAWVSSLNPARGARLRALLEQIDWER
jgi:retron-type reverse transcriptase